MTFLSVIIPTYKRNDLLALCLACLTPGKQSLASDCYEVIVTDDDTAAGAKNFIANNYPWVLWVQGPQKGPAANRNNGAKQAKGDWLVFIDDDCLPDLLLLETYYKSIINNPFVKIFEGKIIPEGIRQSPLAYAPSNIHGGHLWSCNFAITKSTFEVLNGFDSNFKFPHLEDSDLKIRIDSYKMSILFVNNAIVKHPFRNIVDGKKLGRYQEMQIYFNSKHKLNQSLIKLLRRIIGVHWGMIKDCNLSIETFKAFYVLYQHLLVVILNYRKWIKKYVA